MYPVDLMKVRKHPRPLSRRDGGLILSIDTDANHKSFLGRSLYGFVPRSINDLPTRRATDAMERRYECHCRSRCAEPTKRWKLSLTRHAGPAHAVYFGTYEIIKEAAGGNAADGKHHPAAACTEAHGLSI